MGTILRRNVQRSHFWDQCLPLRNCRSLWSRNFRRIFDRGVGVYLAAPPRQNAGMLGRESVYVNKLINLIERKCGAPIVLR
jgi:hypothetical protein